MATKQRDVARRTRVWWAAWRDRLYRLVTLAAAYLTMVSVALAFSPRWQDMSVWTALLLAISLVAMVVLVVLEIRTESGRKVYLKSDREAIRNYMHQWIAQGGRVAIWSRDMSWAETTETRQLLTKKADAKELIICVPRATDLALELEREGAELCAYNGQTYDPASRFTISEFTRVGSRVAVGRTVGELHVIDEFDSADHPAFYLAEDLVRLVRQGNASKADA